MVLKPGESSTSPVKDTGPATPRKRKRSSSPLVNKVATTPRRRHERQSPFPISTLLLRVPGLLTVPPNHKASVTAYVVSLNALRKCLAIPGGLAPDVECRVWTALAELALKVIRAGWTQDGQHPWARSLENEVCNSTILRNPGTK